MSPEASTLRIDQFNCLFCSDGRPRQASPRPFRVFAVRVLNSSPARAFPQIVDSNRQEKRTLIPNASRGAVEACSAARKAAAGVARNGRVSKVRAGSFRIWTNFKIEPDGIRWNLLNIGSCYILICSI